MDSDDEVCLCFHVSQRKLAAFLERERPVVASQLSECLGAGTGCGWCVPTLEEMHRRWSSGHRPGVDADPDAYAAARAAYRESGNRRSTSPDAGRA